MRTILIASLITITTACMTTDELSDTEQHTELTEVDSVPCVVGSRTFPCVSNLEGRTFNNRAPFCLGTGLRLAKDINGLVNPANGTGCLVGSPGSAEDCRAKCGEISAPFTAGCAYQFRFATGEYLGRCFSTNNP